MIKKNSLSFRIISRVLIISSALFILTVAGYYFFSRGIIRESARENAIQLGDNLASKVQQELVSLEKIPLTIASSLGLNLVHHDSIPALLEIILSRNDDVFGLAIAFAPNHIPAKGKLFSPYVHRCLEDPKRLVKGFLDYEYFYRDWYQIPYIMDESYWSEPYYSEINPEVLMTTYSIPFYVQRNGQRIFAGIVALDIKLEWLTEMISRVRIFDTGYAFMVSRNGVALAHPNPLQILNESVFSSAEEWNAPMLREIGRDIVAGKTNFRIYDRGDDYQLYIYHTSLPSGKWSIGVVYPEKEMYRDLQQMNFLMIVMVLSGLIILSVLSVQNINRMASPLAQFADTAKIIAGGDFSARLPKIKNIHEMIELHGAFSHMQEKLADYIKHLKETTSAKEKIESELRIAHEIQMSMIPHSFPPFPSLPQVDLYATLNSAKEVGGDLYDFFSMDDDKFCFAVGDVSGKGVPASLFMAVTRTLLRSIADKVKSTTNIVNILNKSLAINNESCMFVTFFMGILDLKTGTVNYVNAGHNPPVLVRKNNGIEVFEVSKSIPLGIQEEFQYKEQTINMGKGDKIFVYTDGVSEAENIHHELFGEKNMMNLIKQHHYQNPRQLIESIEKAVEVHVAGYLQSDDITMMVVAYNE